jgi:hypothetical protein
LSGLGEKGIIIDAKVYGKKEHDVIAVIKRNKMNLYLESPLDFLDWLR